MTLFNWLVLGHLLGDWAFQTDWMAQGKRSGLVTLAGMVHFLVYTTTILGVIRFFGQPEINPPLFGVVGGVVFVSHWLIDATDGVGRWMRLFGQRDQFMVRVMIDQTAHLLVLGLVARFFLAV